MTNDYKRKTLEAAQRIVNDSEFLYQAMKDLGYEKEVLNHFHMQLIGAKAHLKFLTEQLNERD